MKRIALIFIGVIALLTACDHPVDTNTDEGENNPVDKNKQLSLNIHIPNNNVSTYANEDASKFENWIDSLYVILYQGSTAIDTTGFSRTDISNPNKTFRIVSDSIIEAGYEVDNITTGALRVEVFANSLDPRTLVSNTEVPLPMGNLASSFFMSGKSAQLTNNGTSYFGEVHLIRNVAKLKVNVSLNSVFIPQDLGITYSDIKVQVLQTPDRTAPFDETVDYPGVGYISYPEHSGAGLRPLNSSVLTNGGQIDSCYLYENLRSSFGSSNKTIVRITIPTTSPTEGNKVSYYDYELNTSATGFNIKRNYIYILNIKVRGQSLDPLITLELLPWEEVMIEGSIHGTYLTTDISEIMFDSNGEATINFCTDAQAVYFNFENFNNNNSKKIGFSTSDNITPLGIVPANPLLAPSTHKDGQILLDKQHCGNFTFKLKSGDFPEFPNVNFSGTICILAGNIEKCFTFPGVILYDAHYIVGEPIFNGESFTAASVQINSGIGNWAEVSTSNLYNNSANLTYPGPGAAPLYLHLDENLSGDNRTATISLTNSTGQKRIKITQLPALRVGRFGSASSGEAMLFDMSLFTEQIYEPITLVQYANVASAAIPTTNHIFNGFDMTKANTDLSYYTNGSYNFQATLYSAINYCAYKNRPNIKGNSFTNSDIKWYLPSQAQLMGMWITHESYKNISPPSSITRYFTAQDSIAYWSSTSNSRVISGANEAQYVSFRFGNVGHTKMYLPNDGNQRYWTRCVRHPNTSLQYPTIPMTSTGTYPVTIHFSNGLPSGSYVSGSGNSKTANGNATGTENAINNRTVFDSLYVASKDAASPVKWNAANNCSGYSEGGITTGWRLPTQRELQAIWILQSNIHYYNSNFDLLSDTDYYWSATEALQTWNSSAAKYTNAWVVFGSINDPGGSGNTPHRNKDELSRVRCVRERY